MRVHVFRPLLRTMRHSRPPTGIFFSKDRREEVIEVEEDPEIVTIPGTNQTIKTMTQGQWMKGCPEGGEQGFLFSLYDELSSGSCPCPECKHRFQRSKGGFFALHVSGLWCNIVPSIDPSSSTNSRITSKVFVSSCGSVVPNVRSRSVLRVGSPYQQTKRIGQTQRLTTNPLFHCSNLQGVILGVGLFMLEQLYEQLYVEQSNDSSKGPPNLADKTTRSGRCRMLSRRTRWMRTRICIIPRLLLFAGRRLRAGLGTLAQRKKT